MGDEKTQAQSGDKKQDKPPAPTVQQPAPEQQTGPARASDHQKPEDKKQATPATQTTALQQSVGNQQTNRILRAMRDPGQNKDTAGIPVSHPEDAAEKEAEAVAKKITGDQPAHPADHAGPAPGDPTKIVGDPNTVHGDPDVVHRAVANHDKAPKPPPAHPAPAGPSPASILDHPGAGQPIPQPVRSTLEAKLKADLSHVVVHHDAQSDTAVRALHARAVTRGNHIFLASDASPYDLALMAHEVTHVLKHNNHTVHRQARPGATATGKLDKPGSGSTKQTLIIDSMPVPDIKHAWIQAHKPLTTRTGEARRTQQRSAWRAKVKTGAQTRVKETLAPLKPLVVDGKDVYYFKLKKAPDLYVFGDERGLAEDAIRPHWNKEGAYFVFEIDHKLEYQLGGDDKYPPDNLWLFEAVANGSSGSSIRATINAAVEAVLAFERGRGTSVVADKNEARSQYVVKINDVTGGLAISGHPDVSWDAKQIAETGEQLKVLTPMTAEDVTKAGLRGSPKELVIYLSGTGKGIRRVDWGVDKEKTYATPDPNFFYRTPFLLNKIQWERNKGGKIFGHGFRNNRFVTEEALDFTISPRIGIEFGGEISEETVSKGVSKKLTARGFSPLEFDSAEMVDNLGIVARGRLLPTVPLIAKLGIDTVLSGDEMRLERTFAPGDIPAPAPFVITGSSLTIFAGTKGFGARGDIRFQLAQLARGQITGQVTGEGFALDGKLDFDKTLFQQASIDFFYRKVGSDYQWGAGGKLTIPPNKVPGVQQASIDASYTAGRFTASGDAVLNVPGLQHGSLAITYGDRDGISIGGTFGFAPNPLIAGGSLSATVTKRPPANRWQVSASGTVRPKIPGVDTTLTASYEDGVFTVEGSVAYARGLLSGSLTVGLTNRPLDPQGHPTGAPRPNAPLRPYGGGTLTVKIAPWLQGTVGVQLRPDGSVQLMGKVALPDSINLFDAKEINKDLLTIGLDIPIIGVAVAGQRIGIFATIQGSLQASAGIGPGQLRQLGLEVQYNPEHEDQTVIKGGAQLHIPAHAGLRLSVRGALGAGIPVVSAEAGLEIGGQLGVEGAVTASVEVNWTPKKGLVIDAQASLSAEPKFRFDINGYVKVSADLFVTTINLYEKHWQFAAFEYGSGLRLGITAPIHYEQGKPFTFSLSDVRFDVPKIDPKQILTDLVHKIA
jgi:Domain of unknown function (DUF4157)